MFYECGTSSIHGGIQTGGFWARGKQRPSVEPDCRGTRISRCPAAGLAPQKRREAGGIVAAPQQPARPKIRRRTTKSGLARRHHYVPAGECWLYLAVVLDLFTMKIVGWAMRDHMRAELTITALTVALQRQKPPPGLVHHADRGSQYAAADYRNVLDAAGMIQSRSRKENCSAKPIKGSVERSSMES